MSTHFYEKDFVVLADPENKIRVIGQMSMDSDQCIIDGVLEGITSLDGQTKPDQLQGKSNKRGSVWVDQILSFSHSAPHDESIPATVRIMAMSVYFGDFDPRSAKIDRLTCTLHDVPCLSDDRRLIFPNAATADVLRFDLLLEGPTRIGIDYLPSIGQHTSYTQVMSVEFQVPASLERAAAMMDRSLALLSIVAGGTIESAERSIAAGNQFATEWRSRPRKDDVSNHRQWLDWPGKCVKLLQQLLPGWAKISSDELLLARMFLGAGSQGVYMESRFLGYCQAFESLNSMRSSGLLIDENDYLANVVDRLEPVVSSLSVSARLKRKIRKAIGDANLPALEQRFARAFLETPDWCAQLNSKDWIAIRKRVCKRRNDLSHGSPASAVKDRESATETQIDTHFAYVYCLSELLRRCGASEQEINRLLASSDDLCTLLWLVRKPRSKELKAPARSTRAN